MKSCCKHNYVKTLAFGAQDSVTVCHTQNRESAPKCVCAHLEVSDAPPAFLRNNILLRHCGQNLQSSDLHNVVLLFEIAGQARNENRAHKDHQARNDHYIHLAELPVSRKSGIYPTRGKLKPDQTETSTAGTSQHTNIDICEHDSILGTSLSNSYAQANAAFNSKVYYANGVDYTSQAAINSISYISQAEANYYINQGAALAYSQTSTWGCVPGAYTNMAVNMYATDVNRRKDSANSQIYNIRQNKQAAHDAWVEEQIRLAQEAAYKKWLEQCAAMAIAFMQERDRQTALMNAAMNAANSVFGALELLVQGFGGYYESTDPLAFITRDQSLANNIPKLLLDPDTLEAVVRSAGVDPDTITELLGPGSVARNVLGDFTIGWGVVVDITFSINDNVQKGASGAEIFDDALIDGIFSIGVTAPSFFMGPVLGTVFSVGMDYAFNADWDGDGSSILETVKDLYYEGTKEPNYDVDWLIYYQ